VQEITCFIRTASAGKPAATKLRERGLKVVVGNLASDPLDTMVSWLQGIDTIISPLYGPDVNAQIPLIDAAVQAGVKRFVPSNFSNPVARGGIMDLYDKKEEVHDHIFRQKLGFTIIDVGSWFQVNFPRVPSGKFEYAAINPSNERYVGGTAPNMLIHERDVGRITAQIIKDDRTMNKRVFACGEVLSQNDIYAIIETKTGEKLELKEVCCNRFSKRAQEVYGENKATSEVWLQIDLLSLLLASTSVATLDFPHAWISVVKKLTFHSFSQVSAGNILDDIKAARDALVANPTNVLNQVKLAQLQYLPVKYLRNDNTPENAEYLGYIDGRALYPDFEFTKFSEFVDELIAGNARKPYPQLSI
jgi:hypothetical protein